VHIRYLGLRRLVTGADLVHALELGYWLTAQAARLKARLGSRLVATVWETIPFFEASGHPLANRLRCEVSPTGTV
jgi:hypothetical protein